MKKRVYEAAQELGLETNQLLEILTSLGIKAKSALSTLTEEEIEEVRLTLAAVKTPQRLTRNEQFTDYYDDEVPQTRQRGQYPWLNIVWLGVLFLVFWVIGLLTGPSTADELGTIADLWNKHYDASVHEQAERAFSQWDKAIGNTLSRLDQDLQSAISGEWSYYKGVLVWNGLKEVFSVISSQEVQQVSADLSKRIVSTREELAGLELKTEGGKRVREAALAYFDAAEAVGEGIRRYQNHGANAAKMVSDLGPSGLALLTEKDWEELLRPIIESEKEISRLFEVSHEKFYSVYEVMKEVAQKEGLDCEIDEEKGIILKSQ